MSLNALTCASADSQNIQEHGVDASFAEESPSVTQSLRALRSPWKVVSEEISPVKKRTTVHDSGVRLI